ncbi:MAG: Ppx/GppA family phosphatase [Pseudomonadota bacterium]
MTTDAPPRRAAPKPAARKPPAARAPAPAPDPEAASRRIAVIDVGSNSVRLVVFEALSRSPAYFFNEKVLAGLGAELAETGRLAPEGRRRALAALRRFAGLVRRMRIDAVSAIATAAVREAEDGAAFVAEVKRETGLALSVASGEDEARLAAQGVLMGWPDAHGLVADLGGASLELVRVDAGRVGRGLTLPLGPLRLGRLGLSPAKTDAAIDAALADAGAALGPQGGRLYLVGGAWRALAKIHMNRTRYPIQVLHEFELPADEMLVLARSVAETTPEALSEQVASSRDRLAVTPLGARVLSRLIRAARPASVAVSAFGLREGVLYEHLPPAMRAQDPLLSAARMMERRNARFPGFGAELAAWVRPLLPEAAPAPIPGRARLAEAACLLNDLAWDAHPDYRDHAIFETVYRANLSGVGHAERAWLGAALRFRYKAGRAKRADLPALALLSDEERAQARLLGRAIRLGAMISGSAPGVLPLARLDRTPHHLSLTLDPRIADLAGEAVEKRLAALGESLGCAPDLRIAEPQTA